MTADATQALRDANKRRQRAYTARQEASGLVRLYVWMTAAQREKFRALGSDQWLQTVIDMTRVPKAP